MPSISYTTASSDSIYYTTVSSDSVYYTTYLCSPGWRGPSHYQNRHWETEDTEQTCQPLRLPELSPPRNTILGSCQQPSPGGRFSQTCCCQSPASWDIGLLQQHISSRHTYFLLLYFLLLYLLLLYLLLL